MEAFHHIGPTAQRLESKLDELVHGTQRGTSTISELAGVISAERAFEAQVKVVQSQDEVLETLLEEVNPSERRGRAFNGEA
jgi:flagellar basal body rod protein FlgF